MQSKHSAVGGVIVCRAVQTRANEGTAAWVTARNEVSSDVQCILCQLVPPCRPTNTQQREKCYRIQLKYSITLFRAWSNKSSHLYVPSLPSPPLLLLKDPVSSFLHWFPLHVFKTAPSQKTKCGWLFKMHFVLRDKPHLPLMKNVPHIQSFCVTRNLNISM